MGRYSSSTLNRSLLVLKKSHFLCPLSSAMRHRLVKSAAVVLLVVIAAAAGLLLAWNAGYMRSSFIRFVSWQGGRPINVRGALHLHLLTRSPRIEAEQVTIGNPPWTKPGTMAE